MLLSRTDGYIESDITTFVTNALQQSLALRLSASSQRHWSLAYSSRPPPSFIYTHAFAGYSALVQLQARSGQLPSASLLFSRRLLLSPSCRLGCGFTYEDVHHIFVDCPSIQEFRVAAYTSLLASLSPTLDLLPTEVITQLITMSNLLFSDNASVWPLGLSRYYLGHTPDVECWLPRDMDDISNVMRTRLATRINAVWHDSSVRLAARIWGHLARTSRLSRLDTHRACT